MRTKLAYYIFLIFFAAASAPPFSAPIFAQDFPEDMMPQQVDRRAEERGSRGKMVIDYSKKINFVREGRRYLNENDTDSALYCASYAVANNFDAYDTYILLADIYKKMGRLIDEADAIIKAIEHAPNERLLNQDKKRRDDLVERIKAVRIKSAAKAVAERPESSLRKYRLGHTLDDVNEPEKALMHYEFVDSTAPALKGPKYAAVRLHLRKGDMDAAKAAAKKYFALSPDDTQMVYLLANDGVNINESKELGYGGGGRLDMRRYNRVYADFYYRNGYLQYIKEKYDSAKSSFEYALQYFSTHAGCHKYLGDIFYKRGMLDKAREHMLVAYEVTPSDYEVGLGLAKLLIWDEKKTEAVQILKRLLKINNKSRQYASLLKEAGLRDAEIRRLGYIDPDAPPKRVRPQQGQPGQPGQPGDPLSPFAAPPALNEPFYNQPNALQPYGTPAGSDPSLFQQQYVPPIYQQPPMPPMPTYSPEE